MNKQLRHNRLIFKVSDYSIFFTFFNRYNFNQCKASLLFDIESINIMMIVRIIYNAYYNFSIDAVFMVPCFNALEIKCPFVIILVF